jgi:hypothetical protein
MLEPVGIIWFIAATMVLSDGLSPPETGWEGWLGLPFITGWSKGTGALAPARHCGPSE